MACRSKMGRCSNCHAELLVPPLTRTFRCAACSNVNKITGTFGRVTGWVRSIVSDLTSPTPWTRLDAAASGSTFPTSYPPARGKKRALLCGVSYIGRRYELKGTLNDVNCMKYLLNTRFGFPEECMLVLTGNQHILLYLCKFYSK